MFNMSPEFEFWSASRGLAVGRDREMTVGRDREIQAVLKQSAFPEIVKQS